MMPSWKLVTIALLSAVPVVLLAGFGAWDLYWSGHWGWIWWTLPVCWGLGGYLGRRWSRELQIPLPAIGKHHWTPQDEGASRFIDQQQARVDDLTVEQLTDPKFYAELTQKMALDLARHYHPYAQDPLGEKSVVELLAVARLISEDMEDWFLKNVPGSHLVTVAQWRLLSKAPSWWQTASNVGWVASIALNPANLGRYVVSRLTMEPFTRQVQQNLLGSFYSLYVRQAGFYLIELNSGRLRGGAKRYREMMGRLHSDDLPKAPYTAPTAAGESAPVKITIAVIGQVKAGKSSLVNALLGQQRAETDILPATAKVARYVLRWPERSEELVLLDSPGYSDAGATADQLKETQSAIRDADLVLLVLDARSPARQADLETLKKLDTWWLTQPRLKPPRIVIALNKVDGLSPVLEWSPPYDWRVPQRPKERHIAAAVDYAREVFGQRGVDYVPTCADHEHQRVWNIQETLVPVMSQHLDASRAAALLRSLHQSFEQDRVRQVMGQMIEAGKRVFESIDLGAGSRGKT